MSTVVATVDIKRPFALPSIDVRSRPYASTLVIIACDALALAVSLGFMIVICKWFHAEYDLHSYWHLWPLLGLFPLVYAASGLYPGITLGPVTEVRRATTSTSLVFLILALLSCYLRHALLWSHIAFFLAWATACFAVPFARAFLRRMIGSQSWWGYPVVVFGNGNAKSIVQRLQHQPESGLKPIAILSNGKSGNVNGVPVIGNTGIGKEFVRAGVRHAIVAMPELFHRELVALVDSDVTYSLMCW